MVNEPIHNFLLLLLLLPSSFEESRQSPPSYGAENIAPGPIVYPPEPPQPYQFPPSPSGMTYENTPETNPKPLESQPPPPEKSEIPYQPEISSEPVRIAQPEPLYMVPEPPRKVVELNLPLEYREPLPLNPYVIFNRPELIRPRGPRRYEDYYSKQFVPIEESHHDYFERPYHHPGVIYQPDEMYRPHSMFNRPVSVYNRQPEFEDYAPVIDDLPKNLRRPAYRPHDKYPDPKPTQTPDIPEVFYEEPPRNDTKNENQTSRMIDSPLQNKNQPSDQTIIYTIITDEKSEPEESYSRVPAPKATVENIEMRREKTSRTSQDGKPNIPVPFVKVIRFYPLPDSDEEDDSLEIAPPKFYVSGETREKLTEADKTLVEDSPQYPVYKPKTDSKSSVGTGYAKYVPVYYDLPSYISRVNKTDVEVTGL